MTITEMRELKKQNGYTLEKIVDRSGLDFEIVAKIFSEDDTIGQKEFCKMLSYSEIRPEYAAEGTVDSLCNPVR